MGGCGTSPGERQSAEPSQPPLGRSPTPISNTPIRGMIGPILSGNPVLRLCWCVSHFPDTPALKVRLGEVLTFFPVWRALRPIPSARSLFSRPGMFVSEGLAGNPFLKRTGISCFVPPAPRGAAGKLCLNRVAGLSRELSGWPRWWSCLPPGWVAACRKLFMEMEVATRPRRSVSTRCRRAFTRQTELEDA